MQIMTLMIVLDTYTDENGEGVEVNTTPTKNEEVVKGLSNSSFVTAVVISNALEIVAHDSAAAIEIVHKYGDKETHKLIAAHLGQVGLDGSAIKVKPEDITPGVLREMLKYGEQSDEIQD